MKIKTNELTGTALDWAVAKALGYEVILADFGTIIPWRKRLLPAIRGPRGIQRVACSTDWSQGGPIIEREKLELRPGLYHSELWACWGQTQHGERNSQQGKTGPTPLIAAMRCFVASKLGDEVDAPEELA